MEALKARNGFYRFVLGVDQYRSGMTVGYRKVLLIIPQVRGFYWLLVFMIALSKSVFTFLLSLDAYSKLALTPAEINKSRWIIAGLSTVVLVILLYYLIRSTG